MAIKKLITRAYYYLFIFAIILVALSLLGCSHGRSYRIYVHDAHRGLFIRDLKNKDVLSYKEGHGLVCMPELDLYKAADALATKKAMCNE